MTLELLNKIYEENDIPKDALLMSDSGWECGATDIDGIFYSKADNTVFITQGDWSDIAHGYSNNDPGDCVLIYVPDKYLIEFVDMYNNGIFDNYCKPVIEELNLSTTLRRKIIEELHRKEVTNE